MNQSLNFGFRVSLVAVGSRVGQALKVTGPALPKAVATTPSAPVSDTEKLPAEFTNRLGMEFVLVGKGTAWLGGGNGRQAEKQVAMPENFYLGRYEVTQAEWQQVGFPAFGGRWVRDETDSVTRSGTPQELVLPWGAFFAVSGRGIQNRRSRRKRLLTAARSTGGRVAMEAGYAASCSKATGDT